MTFIHEKQNTDGESRVEACQKCDVNSYSDVAVLLQSHFPPGKSQHQALQTQQRSYLLFC